MSDSLQSCNVPALQPGHEAGGQDETYYLRTWISRIRKKLGDQQDDAALIRTFPGIGYRLESPNETGNAG